MTEWMNEWKIKWANEWMGERVNEWVNELMRGWMNEWMNEWGQVYDAVVRRIFTSFFGVTFVPSASISKRGCSNFLAVSARKVPCSNPYHITSVTVSSPFTAIVAITVTMAWIPGFCPRIPPPLPIHHTHETFSAEEWFATFYSLT